MRCWFAVIAVAVLAACKTGDAVKCEQACRNYATLVHGAETESKIEAAPEADRDALRKKLSAEFARDLEYGIDKCVTQCVSANNAEQNGCLIEAKTAVAARNCVK